MSDRLKIPKPILVGVAEPWGEDRSGCWLRPKVPISIVPQELLLQHHCPAQMLEDPRQGCLPSNELADWRLIFIPHDAAEFYVIFNT